MNDYRRIVDISGGWRSARRMANFIRERYPDYPPGIGEVKMLVDGKFQAPSKWRMFLSRIVGKRPIYKPVVDDGVSYSTFWSESFKFDISVTHRLMRAMEAEGISTDRLLNVLFYEYAMTKRKIQETVGKNHEK